MQNKTHNSFFKEKYRAPKGAMIYVKILPNSSNHCDPLLTKNHVQAKAPEGDGTTAQGLSRTFRPVLRMETVSDTGFPRKWGPKIAQMDNKNKNLASQRIENWHFQI